MTSAAEFRIHCVGSWKAAEKHDASATAACSDQRYGIAGADEVAV